MKYFNLSVFTIIFTAFIMKVIRLVRGKRRPCLSPNGLTPEEWEYAMSHAKICRETELVLQFYNGIGAHTIDCMIGPSLGDGADTIFMHWCWRNLEPSNDFYLTVINRRPTTRGGVLNPSWPLSSKNWIDMMNVYNALMHQAELRECSK